MAGSRITLADALDLTRTGDVWIFRGRTLADRAIRLTTNAPVNHVGMAVTIDDLPPLMWHAELGRAVPDVWSGTRQRGAQLHDMQEAVLTWAGRYGQRAWLRQLRVDGGHGAEQAIEDGALRAIARLDGLPFPPMARLARRWMRARLFGRGQTRTALETAFCAEVVALTYAEMGLLREVRPANWYDPGVFWSGDELDLVPGAELGREIEVSIDEALLLPYRRKRRQD